MRIALIACIVTIVALKVNARDNFPMYSFKHGEIEREYAMFVPENLPEDAPWVVYTHGYGATKSWDDDLNATASREGFAVCYPVGLPDIKGKNGWKVGYPPQEEMQVDEADFFKHLKDEVTTRFKLSTENAFMTGMSNGGDLCYQLAFTAPGLFRAYASVAGLLFECTFLNYPLPQPVPFMEIHGDADKVSFWNGDHGNTGGWGRYVPVPVAVGTMVTANRCCSMSTDTIPLLNDSTRFASRTIYFDSPQGCNVELWRIHGGKHSWFKKEVATHDVVWRFFESYIKPE